MTRLVAVAVLLSTGLPGGLTGQEMEGRPFGLVLGRSATQHAVLVDGEWRRAPAVLGEGAEVEIFTRDGGRHQTTVGAPMFEDWGNAGPRVIHRLTDAPDVDRSGYFSSQPSGYFVAAGVVHAPFLRAEASQVDWRAILAEAEPPVPDLPSRVSGEVWTADLGETSVSVFLATREQEKECVPYVQTLGGIDEEGSTDVWIKSVGDCYGRGSEWRAPYALIRHAGRVFMLIAFSHMEEDDGELWELTSEGLVQVELAG